MPNVDVGDRPSLPGGGATPSPHCDKAAQGSAAGPVNVKKQLGVPLAALLVPFAIAAAVQLFPLVVSGLPLTDALLHTSTAVILGLLALLLASIYATTRSSGVLNVDSAGIDVRIGKKHYFYNWIDIEHFDQVKSGVRISLRGRSVEQNQYNIVPARFAGSPGELRQLLSSAQVRLGAGPPKGPATIAPGDNLRRARIRSSLYTLMLVTAPLLAIFTAVLIWQASDCLKALDLQKRGQRTQAAVTRIYTSGCGRSGCMLDAEFSYVSVKDGRRYIGRGYLANARHHDDANLAYVRSYGAAPIVYDPARPHVVELNFNDQVFRKDPTKVFLSMIGLVGGICGFLTMVFAASLLPVIVQAFRTPNSAAPSVAAT
jgi:hypothetical protein